MTRMQGTGTKTTLPSGSIRVRLWLDGNRKSRTFATEAQADDFLALHQNQRAAGEVSPSAPTLDDWGKKWLRGRTCRSVDTEVSRWKAQVAPAPIARLRLDQISRGDILDYAAWLGRRRRTVVQEDRRVVSEDRISRQTQKHALKLVQLALDGAVDRGLIAVSPAAGVRLGKREQIDDDWTWLEQGEIDSLLSSSVLAAEARDLYQVAIYTGLRAGELWALAWPCVHLAGPRPELEVRRSHGGATKSGKPRRVPLLAPAVAALRRLAARAEQDAEGKPVGLVFPGQKGERHGLGYDGGWADKRQRRRKRGKPDGAVVTTAGHKTLAGIVRPVRFHDLRHTCASHLIQGTWGRVWALEEVRDFLGHSSISVTQRYAHLGERLHRAAAATPGAGGEHEHGDDPAGGADRRPVGDLGRPAAAPPAPAAAIPGQAPARRPPAAVDVAATVSAVVAPRPAGLHPGVGQGAAARLIVGDTKGTRQPDPPAAADVQRGLLSRGSLVRVQPGALVGDEGGGAEEAVSPRVPIADLARAALQRAAEGVLPWAELQDLAEAVLAERQVVLAEEVRQGGDRAVAAGLELAALVLREQGQVRQVG